MDASTLAMADQLTATVNDDLDILISAVRNGDARHGEAENLANFIAALAEDVIPAPYMAALLIVALRRAGKA